MNIVDVKYLESKKVEIVGKCKCKGEDYNHGCWKKFAVEVEKVKSNIPLKYRDYNLDIISHPHVQDIKSKVKEYIDNIDKNRKTGLGLYLYGSQGLGKTVMGCVVLMEAIKKGYKVYFSYFAECLDILIGTRLGEEERKEVANKILEADFLMIDNVDFERAKTTLLNTSVDMLLRKRADSKLINIITANYSIEEISGHYGYQISSLFAENAIELHFKGADYRKNVIKKANAKHA
jgi:DNA replication protein DnaC